MDEKTTAGEFAESLDDMLERLRDRADSLKAKYSENARLYSSRSSWTAYFEAKYIRMGVDELADLARAASEKALAADATDTASVASAVSAAVAAHRFHDIYKEDCPCSLPVLVKIKKRLAELVGRGSSKALRETVTREWI